MVFPSDDLIPCYKDRFLRTDYSEPLDYNDSSCTNPVAFPDLTTPITYPIQLSQSQWGEIAACILQGAVVIYPNSIQRIYWNFARALECPSMDCQWVIDCLEDPESGVSEAFTAWMLDQMQNNPDVQAVSGGYGGDQTTPIDANSDVLISECDKDILFGFCVQIVDLMHTVVEDFYEILEAATNFNEALNITAGQVNALSTLLSWVEFMQNSVVDAYQANYTVELRNEYACGLFCIAVDEPSCSLTWEAITDYFAEKLTYSTQGTSLTDLLTFLLSGTWHGTQYCDFSHLVFAFVMRVGAAWTGMNLPLLQQIAMSYLNDPDPDWATLCDCVGYDYYYEFENQDSKGWTQFQGSWLTSDNRFWNNITGLHNRLVVDRTFTGFDGLKEVGFPSCDYDHDGHSTVGAGITVHVVHSGGTYNEVVPNATPSFTHILPSTLNGVTRVFLSFRLNNVGEGGACFIRGPRLKGVGAVKPPAPPD